jgi:Predicted membrane protein
MELMTQMLISGILSASLSLIAYRFRALTFSGAIASFFVGYIVGLFGSVEWLVLLVGFTMVGIAVTKMDFSNKKRNGLHEGNEGERSHKNVLGVGFPPCLIAVLFAVSHSMLNGQYDLALTVAFICTLSVAAADTVASEIGARDMKVWLITTFERVKRGTNGGVSVTGTAFSLAASAVTSIVGWLLIYGGFDVYILIPFVMGFLGNILDSVLGATLENKGIISKYTNNCVSALIGAALGAVIVLII